MISMIFSLIMGVFYPCHRFASKFFWLYAVINVVLITEGDIDEEFIEFGDTFSEISTRKVPVYDIVELLG